jgi:hypothetical protein
MYLNQLDLETLGSQLLSPQIVPEISLQQELVGSHTGNSLIRSSSSKPVCKWSIYFGFYVKGGHFDIPWFTKNLHEETRLGSVLPINVWSFFEAFQ